MIFNILGMSVIVKMYVDDTLCYIKTDSIDYVLKMLNGFHRSIQFAYEVNT